MTAAAMPRDFSGYRWNPPRMRWPGNTGLAVSFVLNVEEGAEFALSAGDPRNEGRHEIVHEVVGARDLCMESHFEYGARVGYWRITRLLMEAGLPLTLNACGRALEITPWIAADAAAQGFEVCCHGWRWESHVGLPEDEERERIARCAETIRRLHGRAPVGWHTRSSASINTRRLLVEHGGFLYDSDAYNDDLPYYLPIAGRSHLVLPYAFDTNDLRFFEPGGFTRGDDFADYTIDAFECLMRESSHAPRMMSIGLHTRIIGRPGRFGGLQRVVAHITSRQGAWCATREQIARHWLAQVPAEKVDEAAME